MKVNGEVMIRLGLQKALEGAVALSLRPSQYVGWEIGSAAKKILEDPAMDKSSLKVEHLELKRVGLLWPVPYMAAMKEECFIELYETLASAKELMVERIMKPGDDLCAILTRFGISAKWFSVETKSLLDNFDAFVVKMNSVVSEDMELMQYFQKLKSKVFYIESSLAALNGREVAFRALEQWQWRVSWGRKEKLLAFASGGPTQDPPFETEEGTEKISQGQNLHHCARPLSRGLHRKFSYRARIGREGWARFLSHLEQIQIIKQVLKLGHFPVALTQAKNPKIKVSFGPAVSVGWSSRAEFFDVDLDSFIDPLEFRRRLEAELPLGYRLISIERIPSHFPSLEESANWVEYEIYRREGFPVDWGPLIQVGQGMGLKEAQGLSVRKEKPGGAVDIIYIGEVLARAETAVSNEGEEILKMAMRFGPKKNLKPEKIFEVILGLSAEQIKERLIICRAALALELGGKRLRYL